MEKMYIAELKPHNIEITSHVTRFSEKLTSSIEGLVSIYCTVRSRTLVDYFFPIGMSIPYKRVLQITKYLSEKLILSFHLNDVFLPGILRKGLFTISTKDDIDKNA